MQTVSLRLLPDSVAAVFDKGAYWLHLSNTIQQSVRGGDAVLCGITLTTCYPHDAVLMH